MKKSNPNGLTEKNLDRLAEFLEAEIKHPALAGQIPNGALLFYGSHKDANLTRDNLKLATKVLLGMALGYVEEAPMVMIFVDKSGQKRTIDLPKEALKGKAFEFIDNFQNQGQQEMRAKINDLLAA